MGKVSALIIGTGHEYQRYQDAMAERNLRRAQFGELLRRVIAERKVDLIAEEAGDNQAVLESLKADEAATAAFDGLFADLNAKVIDEPKDTIARTIASESGVRWVDIRHRCAEEMSIRERDVAMAETIIEVLDGAESILTICGEDHRIGMSGLLQQRGLRVESRAFLDQ